MSLIASRRYLLVDDVERWSAKHAAPVIAALAALPADLTVVFVARELGPKAGAPKGLADAVKGAGGEVLPYKAPRARDLPARLVADAGRRGLRLEPAAARLLVERLGESTLRLSNELDRLALWAGPQGEVTVADLEEMVADTSQEASWALSDAIVAQDAPAALGASERLLVQGEAVDAARLRGGAPPARRERRTRGARVRDAGAGSRTEAPYAPLRRQDAGPTAAGGLQPRASRSMLCDRRSRVVDSGRVRVPGRRGADACGPASGRCRRRCGLSSGARRFGYPRRWPPLPGRSAKQTRGLGLLAGAVVRMQGALLDRLVDP